MINNKEVLDRIYLLLDDFNLTRIQFCKEIGIKVSSFDSWNSRKTIPTTEILCTIAEHFNVSLDWLLFGTSNSSFLTCSKKIKENEKNSSINTFSERIDAVLSLMKIKKVQFYSDLVLSRQTVIQWRKGSIPSADKLLLVADYLDIHPEWLLKGKISNKQNYDLDSTKSQVSRIYQILENNFHCHPGDPDFFMPLQNCVTEVQLKKWELGMQIPAIIQLKDISEKLGISILYLINGTEVSKLQSQFEVTIIQNYYCLNDENKKTVDEIIKAFYAKQVFDGKQ